MKLELFGRIDQTNISPVGDYESDAVVLDCFGVTKRTTKGEAPHPKDSDDDLDTHYPVLAFSITKNRFASVLGTAPHSLVALDDRWFRLSLENGRGPGPKVVLAGSNNEGKPAFRLVEAEIADEDMQRKLDSIVASVFKSKETPIKQVDALIAKALQSSTKLDVSVVDVGQGSLAAMHAPGGTPLLFFDLGWPTMFHAASAPNLKPLLNDDEVPVILSHWDWDHWALAIEKAGWNKKKKCWSISWNNLALNRPWLVPGSGGSWGDVKLGPIHWRLALALARRKHLIRWPAGSAQRGWDLLTVYRAKGGKKKDRNQHGLAMVIDNTEKSKRNDVPRRAILLPGDADYVNLPFLVPATPYLYCGLAATHHGAKFTPAAVPAAAEPAWLAYSVGTPNFYKHPRRFAQYRYIRAGWAYQAHTTHRVAQAGAAPGVVSSGSVLLTTDEVRVLPATASGAAWLGKQ